MDTIGRLWRTFKIHFDAVDFRSVVLGIISFYAAALIVSVLLAHVFAVIFPNSDWADRLISPVQSGLIFLDTHWKAALMVVAPFFFTEAADLLSRIQSIKFGDKLELNLEGGTRRKKRGMLVEKSEDNG